MWKKEEKEELEIEEKEELQHFQQCCLHSLSVIKWQGYMSNEEVFKKAQSAQYRDHLTSGSVALGWPCCKDERHASPKQSSSVSSKKRSTAVMHQESVTKTS